MLFSLDLSNRGRWGHLLPTVFGFHIGRIAVIMTYKTNPLSSITN